MRKIIFLFFFLFSVALHAENIYYTPASSKVFFSEELRSFIIHVAYQTIDDRTVPKSIFKNLYLSVEKELLEKTRSEIVLRFKKIEASRSSVSDKKYLYKAEVEEVIIEFILNNPSISKQLAFDHSDRILKFYSDIEVQQDGMLHITEYITIYNGDGLQTSFYTDGVKNYYNDVNNFINYGIYRDFSALYTSNFGIENKAPLEIKRIQRNGRDENYTTQSIENGVRLIIRSEGRMVPLGVQSYIVEYETKYQVTFQENKDELNWNVNGNEWPLTTDSTFCKVTFPGEAIIIDQACYTGSQGSTLRNCICKPGNSSTINFYTDFKLGSYKSLTINASIQKGIIQPPSIIERILILIKPNWQLSGMVVVFCFICLVNFYYWIRYGIDPKKGIIYPRFDPPHGLSPAAVGFIYNQCYKNDHFSAALVDLAIKKAIVIEVEDRSDLYVNYRFYKFKKPELVDPSFFEVTQQAYNWDLKELFGLTVSATYDPVLRKLSENLKEHLSQNYQKDYKNNKNKKGYFVINITSLIIGAISLFLIAMVTFMAFTTSFFGVYLIPIALVYIACILVQVFFSRILSAYSVEGMKVREEIEGFKMYLSAAEEKRYDLLNVPEKSIATFEKFLPYAIALDCQIQWGNTFEVVLTDAIKEGSYQSKYYGEDSPSNFSISSFKSSLGKGTSKPILPILNRSTGSKNSKDRRSEGGSFDGNSGSY